MELSIKGSTDIIQNENMTFYKQEANFSKLDYKTISNTPHITTLCFHTDYVEQKTAVQFIIETPLNSATDNIYTNSFETKDNKFVEVSYRLSFAFVIDVWLTSESHKPITKQFNIVLIDCSNATILEHFKKESEDKNKEHKDKLSKFNLFEKFMYYFARNHPLKPTIDYINIIYLPDDIIANENINKVDKINIAQGVISSDGFLSLPFLNYNGYPYENYKNDGSKFQ